MISPSRVSRGIAPAQRQVFHVMREVMTCIAMAAHTGGAYALFEQETPPGAGLPPRRLHLEDIAYFGLSGTYEVRIGDETHELGSGAYAFVPRGMIHAYQNVASTPARMLVVVSPGGIHERFLSEVGSPLADGSYPDLEKILAAAPKYGIEFLSLPA